MNKSCLAGFFARRKIDLPAGRSSSARAMKEREAQRLHGRKARKCGVVSRAPALLGTGVDLEVRQQIMREGDELLPIAVGGVGKGWHSVEGESTLQLRNGFLVRAAAGYEVPEVRERVVELGPSL